MTASQTGPSRMSASAIHANAWPSTDPADGEDYAALLTATREVLRPQVVGV